MTQPILSRPVPASIECQSEIDKDLVRIYYGDLGAFYRVRAALAATPAVGGEWEALAEKLENMHWEAGAYPISCAELELCINALRAAPPASPLRGDHSALAVRLGHMSKWFTDQSYEATTLREAQAALASPPEQPADPLSDLVSGFAKALLAKLRLASANGRSGWERDDWEKQCQQGLLRHLEKGDPRDVAAYCAFMWHHGWITAPPDATQNRNVSG